MPIVFNLRNPALKDRHWVQLESILQNKIPGRDTTDGSFNNVYIS